MAFDKEGRIKKKKDLLWTVNLLNDQIHLRTYLASEHTSNGRNKVGVGVELSKHKLCSHTFLPQRK